MRIVAVVLHYGQKTLTDRVFASLLEGSLADRAHIRVLDNAAPEVFAGAWKRLEKNVYWAGALDSTLKAVADEGYTHLWFINNDVGFVTAAPLLARVQARLEGALRRGCPIGIWSPAVQQNPYHKHMEPCAAMSGDSSKLLPGMRQVPLIDGIAPVFSLDCLQDIGGLDYGDNLYGYGVDMWLSIRARRAGWPLVVDDTMVIRHRYHTTAKTTSGFMQKAALAEHAFMTERLGPDWRKTMERLKATC